MSHTTSPTKALAIGIVLWSIGSAFVLAWLLHNYSFDDPYITYRYAEHMAQGHGFVYNDGDYTLSTTAPFYGMLLALVHVVGINVPLASNIIGCISLALGGTLLWLLGQRWHTPVAGIAAMVLYPTLPLMASTIGAETSFSMLLIMGGITAAAYARHTTMALCFAFATLTRADSVVAFGIVVCALLLRTPQDSTSRSGNSSVRARIGMMPWRAFALYGAIVLPCVLLAWWYYGAPLPTTLAAKQQQGTMSISERFFHGLFLLSYWHSPSYVLHMVFALGGALFMLMWKRHWLVVVGWSIAFAAAYSILGVTSYFWYYAPVMLGFVIVVALGIEALNDVAHRIAVIPHTAIVIALVVVLLVLLYPQLRGTLKISTRHNSRAIVYQEVGTWIANNTPPDATVGTLEVGIIGYYAHRHMIDFAGLLQPATARQFSPTTTYEDAALWAFNHYRPTYVILHTGMFARFEQQVVADESRCRAIHAVGDGTMHLTVYQCDATACVAK